MTCCRYGRAKVSFCYGHVALVQTHMFEGDYRYATYSLWFPQVSSLGHSDTEPDQHVLCYLLDGHARGLVREKLYVIFPNTRPGAT